MSTARSTALSSLPAGLRHQSRPRAFVLPCRHFLAAARRRDGSLTPQIRGLRALMIAPWWRRRNHTKIYRNTVVRSSFPQESPLPSGSPNSWNPWILGMLLTIILPFLKHKWGPLLKLTREIETAAEAAEHVTEMVEKVAEEVEKVTEEVVDELPEGGKLKKAVAFVENVAKETAKDAHLAQDIIEKVEETAKEMDSFLEPADANGISKEASDEK